jgi:hypothetical protein
MDMPKCEKDMRNENKVLVEAPGRHKGRPDSK